MRKSLTKNERLGKRSDLKRVFSEGKHISSRGAKLIYVSNGLAFNRFAVALVRKYGNSVERNKAKRVLREIYRESKDSLISGYDIIVVLYPGNLTFIERKKQFYSLMKRGDLVKVS
ncbi:ribonuclease P protein component [Spirochaeta isovalerica]|uniref:ribonuclease P protein component n=1 Tax=Spirochaeta isovalerica TaxID=150 RepID=UPI00161E310E|nr:ribonuclease P protein component [Spirochaeta isovalerica]